MHALVGIGPKVAGLHHVRRTTFRFMSHCAFAWNGKTYATLTKIAFAITGTRWSGPRFFGLRDKPSKGAKL
jgi:Protein of unknown function (DUF2924)